LSKESIEISVGFHIVVFVEILSGGSFFISCNNTFSLLFAVVGTFCVLLTLFDVNGFCLIRRMWLFLYKNKFSHIEVEGKEKGVEGKSLS